MIGSFNSIRSAALRPFGAVLRLSERLTIHIIAYDAEFVGVPRRSSDSTAIDHEKNEINEMKIAMEVRVAGAEDNATRMTQTVRGRRGHPLIPEG
jgi:hypothetical protein